MHRLLADDYIDESKNTSTERRHSMSPIDIDFPMLYSDLLSWLYSPHGLKQNIRQEG